MYVFSGVGQSCTAFGFFGVNGHIVSLIHHCNCSFFFSDSPL